MTSSHVTILAIALSAAGCVDTVRNAGTPDGLTIDVDVREVDGKMKTMSRYHVEEGEPITFRNRSESALMVTPRVKEPDGNHPFCDETRRNIRRDVHVPGKSKEPVHICEDFKGLEILYTAQIEGADPEDPIVIIE